jgi:hypothetical protein
MTSEFLVITTSRFDPELKKLASQHPGLAEILRRVIAILRTDPYNRSRQHAIKKLEALRATMGKPLNSQARFCEPAKVRLPSWYANVSVTPASLYYSPRRGPGGAG